jgi:hypothetical protein
MALPYDEWLKRAEPYFLTPSSYEQLTVGQEYPVIQADFMNFLAREGPGTQSPVREGPGTQSPVREGQMQSLELNQIYAPSDLINFQEHIVPLEIKELNMSPVFSSGTHSNLEMTINYGAMLYPYDGEPSYIIKLYVTKHEPWIASGNGDGYSRWLLWDDFVTLPQFYFVPYDENDEIDNVST